MRIKRVRPATRDDGAQNHDHLHRFMDILSDAAASINDADDGNDWPLAVATILAASAVALMAVVA